MKVDGKTGKHAAGELMIGAQGTECMLQVCVSCAPSGRAGGRAGGREEHACAFLQVSSLVCTVSKVHVADGRYGQLLRVQQSAGDDGSSGGADKVKLTEISVTIPRTLKAESFTSQHF
jgi:hypothetical protein